MENISLALQGYNYGIEYIQWVQDYFGGYTRENAMVISMKGKQNFKLILMGIQNMSVM